MELSRFQGCQVWLIIANLANLRITEYNLQMLTTVSLIFGQCYQLKVFFKAFLTNLGTFRVFEATL